MTARNWQNRTYSAPVGSEAAGAAFKGYMNALRRGRSVAGLIARFVSRITLAP